jgi:hypothetical protein
MRPWMSTYPAIFIEIDSDGEVIFELNLGWGVTMRRGIKIEFSMSFDKTQKLFIQRRLENILSTAKHIFIDVTWDDSGPFCEIIVNGEDLTDLMVTQGVLPK